MSVIGPRPGLWNQDILTAERDKYNARALCTHDRELNNQKLVEIYKEVVEKCK